MAAFGFIGASRTTWGALSLPLELSLLGAPGCSLYTGVGLVVPLTVTAGVASWSIPIPLNASLVGQSFFTQGILAGDPINPGKIVTSNDVVARVGLR